LLQRDKQFNEANERLSALQSKFPKQIVRLTLIQAELFSQQKNYEKSFEILSKALAENPNQKEYLYARALIAEHLSKLDVVEGDLNKILAIEPNNVETLNALGYSLLNNPSRYVDAEKFLKKALSLSPNEAVIIDSYGWLQFKLGNFSGALNYLQQAYDKQKEPEIAAHLAEVMWASGKRDEAEKLVSRLIRENPADEYLKDVEKRIFKGAK
jgi:Flp pilus assembly protein TadD